MSLLHYSFYSNNICHKTQVAAQLMVQDRVTAGAQESDIPLESIFAGIGIGDLTAKRVVLLCKRAVPQTVWEGNWDADLQVQVIGPAADFESADDFHAYAGQVFAFFFQAPATVCERLSNPTVKYTAQFIVPTGANWEFLDENVEGWHGPASWVSEQNFRVTCSGSVIE